MPGELEQSALLMLILHLRGMPRNQKLYSAVLTGPSLTSGPIAPSHQGPVRPATENTPVWAKVWWSPLPRISAGRSHPFDSAQLVLSIMCSTSKTILSIYEEIIRSSQ